MDKSELTLEQIEQGRKFILEVDKNIKLSAAFWFLIPDHGWRFVLTSKTLDNKSPANRYEIIQKEFSNILGENNELLNNTSIIKTDHALIKLLSSAINTSSDAVSGIRFSENVINNQYIKDAYIYRLSIP